MSSSRFQSQAPNISDHEGFFKLSDTCSKFHFIEKMHSLCISYLWYDLLIRRTKQIFTRQSNLNLLFSIKLDGRLFLIWNRTDRIYTVEMNFYTKYGHHWRREKLPFPFQVPWNNNNTCTCSPFVNLPSSQKIFRVYWLRNPLIQERITTYYPLVRWKAWPTKIVRSGLDKDNKIWVSHLRALC